MAHVSRRALAAASLTAVVTAATGCGSSTKTPSTASGGAPGTITMRSLSFHPTSVTVKVGRKVTWRNDDNVDHNVTATRGAKFMSKAFGNGGRYSFTPRKPGTIRYVCTLHPGMEGELVVK